MWLVILVVASILSGVQSTSYRSLDVANADYQDGMMQELYKRLSQIDQGFYKDVPDSNQGDSYRRLSQSDPSFFKDAADFEDEGDELAGTGFPAGTLYEGSDRITHAERSPGQADIRDSEYLAHSANTANSGYLYVSGGAGEGIQHLNPEGLFKNIAQVKSDETLPSYCHPPNPCPKGYTAQDGCHEFIDDTAEVQQAWIEKMQAKGICSCDEEHMFNCPKGQSMVTKINNNNNVVDSSNDRRLNEVIDKILNEKTTNPYAGGQKRKSLVAKKSPRVKRSAANDKMEYELEKLAHSKRSSNPYLSGEKLRTVAKKGYTKV